MLQHGLHSLEGQPLAGNFAWTQDSTVPGVLTLRGPDTSIFLWNLALVGELAPPAVVTGVINAQTVSLVDFHQDISSGLQTGPAGPSVSLIAFPKYVAVGNFRLTPDEHIIDSVRFTTDEAHLLCSPSEAFGSLHGEKARKIVKQILRLKNRIGQAGEHPLVTYFTGENSIFTAGSVWGQVTAWHNPRITVSIDRPDQFSSEIVIELKFSSAVDFACALKRTKSVLHLLELLIGRPQNVTALHLLRKTDSDLPNYVEVYECLAPRYHRPKPSSSRPIPFLAPQELEQVMPHWIERAASWEAARSLLYEGFIKRHQYQHHFFNERLVAAVNMFELLPQDALPETKTLSQGTKTLSKELQAAVEKTKELFKACPESPESPECDQVIRLMDKLGQASMKQKIYMKQKIHHRAKIIGNRLEDRANLENMTENLCAIADAAVNCRNFFVHGTEKGPHYWQSQCILRFLAETLEFIFTASDLVEAGWNPQVWVSSSMLSRSHPLDDYILTYQNNLNAFRAFVSKSKQIEPTSLKPPAV